MTPEEFLTIWNAACAVLPTKRGWPCSICGRRYKDQSQAGWCCFEKKESEDSLSREPSER